MPNYLKDRNGVPIISGVRADGHKNSVFSAGLARKDAGGQIQNTATCIVWLFNNLGLRGTLRVFGLSQRCNCVRSCWM